MEGLVKRQRKTVDMRVYGRCEKGHDFICKKCGMSFDERIKELGNEGLENMGIVMKKLQGEM